ncbi:unnamed protein product [Lactuca saligna]|uniref:Uncharacterized protein n=1 Tax=Lactuca saligna TaxID=75948 RepID=A0AA35Y5N1_LACSI|nr:unnamed protein product [Lactuca saligna]
MADRSNFSFIGSILEVMFCDVPPTSKILEGYRTLTPSVPRPLTNGFQEILAERKAPTASTTAPKRRKQHARKRKSPTPTLSQREGENTDSETESKIRIEEDPPAHIAEDEPASSLNHEVTPPFNDSVPSPPPSPKTTTSIPITIAPIPPPVSSQPSTTIALSISIFTESTISPHTSPIRTDDSEMLFRDDEDDDLDGFTFSAF